MRTDNLIEVVNKIRNNNPQNAFELRKYSDEIVSAWIKDRLDYPHDLLDNFVYIESSIERIVYEYSKEPISLQNKMNDSYNFHISHFLYSLSNLERYIQTNLDGSAST